MRLIYLAPVDPRNVRKWSGTVHYLYRALADRFGPVPFVTGRLVDRPMSRFSGLLRRAGFTGDLRFTTLFAFIVGVYLSLRLAVVAGDVIVAVAASNYLRFLVTRRPIIYVSDATFAAICRTHESFDRFPDFLKRQGNANEAAAIASAARVIYSSRWALASAIADYGAHRGKLMEQPLGANMPAEVIARHVEQKFGQQRSARGRPSRDTIRVLFIGSDWGAKGGDLVVATCARLVERGYDARAILVGDVPQRVAALPFVERVGFVDKSTPDGVERLCRLLAAADVLMVPTEADAFGIVFVEAQAFGVPSLSFDVGGVSSAVIDGETGTLLPKGAGAEDFAAAIERLIGNPGEYARMSARCRDRYERSANWTVWAKLIEDVAMQALDRGVAGRGRVLVDEGPRELSS